MSCYKQGNWWCLTAKAIEGASLPLESIDHIHSGDSLPLGVLGVGDSIPDHVLQEDLEDTSGLFVDESADSLDSTSASQSTDGGLRDTLDVVTKDFPVTLSASLSKTFASFTTSRHLDLRKFVREFKAIRKISVDCKIAKVSRSIRYEISERWRRHLSRPIRFDFLNTSVHKHNIATFFFKTEHTFLTPVSAHFNILTYFFRQNPTAAKI